MNDNATHVLIIDDDPGIVFLHKIIIREGKLNSNPSAFTDARKALDFIAPLDIVGSKFIIFLDINMPKIDGWEFLNLLSGKIKHADIKVIMVTSSMSKSEREKSKNYEIIIDFWEKPMDEIKISGLIKNLGDWLVQE